MQVTTYTVNEQGLNEIKEFLAANHVNGDFPRSDLVAWAADAELQLGEGNPATIEIPARNSVHGRTQEFTISDAGLDAVTVEIDGWDRIIKEQASHYGLTVEQHAKLMNGVAQVQGELEASGVDHPCKLQAD